MKVVVTGGAGFIGANLCRTLADRPEIAEVVALDDLSTGRRANLEECRRSSLVEGSILDADLLDRVFAGSQRRRPPGRPAFGAPLPDRSHGQPPDQRHRDHGGPGGGPAGRWGPRW